MCVVDSLGVLLYDIQECVPYTYLMLYGRAIKLGTPEVTHMDCLGAALRCLIAASIVDSCRLMIKAYCGGIQMKELMN